MTDKQKAEADALDNALAAARRIVKLEEDPHPGLFTWGMAMQNAYQDFKGAVRKVPPE